MTTVNPEDSILLKCGVGHVKRSINGGVAWSDITPGTDPPNDAGDVIAPTKTGVTYFRLDGSFINQGEFVALARWQNATSDWRSWLAFTDDDGSTWSWKYLGDPPVGCVEPGTKSSAFSTGSWDGTSGYAHRGNPVLEVATDKYVITYRDISENNVYVRCFSMSGDDVTWGSAVDVDACAVTGGSGSQLCFVDTNKFAVSYQAPGGGGELCRPGIKIGTISGETIALGSVQHIMNDYESVQLDGIYEVGMGISAVCPSTSRIAVLRFGKIMESSGANFVESSDYGWWVLWGDISFSTITWEVWENPTGCGSTQQETVGKWRAAERSMVINEWNNSVAIQMSGGYGLFMYQNGYDHTVTIFTVTAAEDSIDGITEVVSSDWSVGACLFNLSGTKAILVWQEFPAPNYIMKAKVITVTGATPTIGAANTLRTSAGGNDWTEDYYGAALTSSLAVLSYWIYYADCQSNMMLDISGDTITVADVCDSMWAGATGGVHGHTATKYMIMGHDSGNGIMFTGVTADDVETCYPYGQARALGGQIGRGTGTKAWVTIHDGSNIELLEITLSTLVIADRVDLGAATEAEVDAGTYVAWPFTMFGGEDNVYVFGRMNNPDGLGSPSHIIYTGNGGTDFSLLEGGWLGDTCGALFAWGMLIVAIRNTGLGAKVYLWDGVDFNLKSTSPLNAGVRVKGMAVDHRDMTLVLCSNVADTVMVVGSIYPYVEWTDITSNHPNVSGVFAVQIL